jgi:hypothetical protein
MPHRDGQLTRSETLRLCAGAIIRIESRGDRRGAPHFVRARADRADREEQTARILLTR